MGSCNVELLRLQTRGNSHVPVIPDLSPPMDPVQASPGSSKSSSPLTWNSGCRNTLTIQISQVQGLETPNSRPPVQDFRSRTPALTLEFQNTREQTTSQPPLVFSCLICSIPWNNDHSQKYNLLLKIYKCIYEWFIEVLIVIISVTEIQCSYIWLSVYSHFLQCTYTAIAIIKAKTKNLGQT